MGIEAKQLAVDICAEFEAFRAFPYPDPASPLAKATPKVKWGFSSATELRSKLPYATQALSGSPWTIGYGQTGPSVIAGSPEMTQFQARMLLDIEVMRRLSEIERRSSLKFTAGQLAALTSFLFNVGPGKYGVKDGLFELKSARRPSTLWVLSQKGAHLGAAEQFQFWTKAQGAVMPGLVRRRKAERALYLRQVP
jgi:lysozyme